MRKLIFILLLAPLSLLGQSYRSVGNALKMSYDGLNFVTSLGDGTTVSWWTKIQSDSLWHNVPTYPTSDISLNPVNTTLMHEFAADSAAVLDSGYFDGKGTDNAHPITLKTLLKFRDTVRVVRAPTNIYDVVNLGYLIGHTYVFGGSTAQYTDGTGAYQPFPTNVSNFANDAGYATVTQVKVSRTGVHFGQTASDPSLITKANTGGDNSYDIGGFINILANPSLSDNIVMQVSWTAENGVVNTQILYEPGTSTGATLSTIREHGFSHVFIRVKDATTITISTTVAGSGSILYNDGGLINKVVGDGGL